MKISPSRTLFNYLSGAGQYDVESHPQSLEDIRQCRLLLEQQPHLAKRLSEIAHLSREWAAVSAFWEDLCIMQDLEDPDWRTKAGKARETQTMLNTIINQDVI